MRKSKVVSLVGAGVVSLALIATSPASAHQEIAQAVPVMTGEAASASVEECTNNRNGFVSIAYNLSGTIKRSVDLGGGRRAELHVGYVNGVQRGWARISGATRRGDQVWMDWSTTGGNGWLQCGPFTVQSDGSPNTSAAQKVRGDLPAWVFRACGLVNGVGKCTGWW